MKVEQPKKPDLFVGWHWLQFPLDVFQIVARIDSEVFVQLDINDISCGCPRRHLYLTFLFVKGEVGAVDVAGGGGEIGGEPATLPIAVYLNFSLYFVVDQRILTFLSTEEYGFEIYVNIKPKY